MKKLDVYKSMHINLQIHCFSLALKARNYKYAVARNGHFIFD